MKKITYNKVEKVNITCKCGRVLRTSSVEYFCPFCNTLLSNPIGSNVAHVVYDYADEVTT